MNRRRRAITVDASGRWFDEDVFRAYLASLDAKAPKRATVERLSEDQR